jgi:Zn finger protein HypA/HybF involved in hydrogenase expression
MPDYFEVKHCPGCGNLYPEQMLTNGLCDGCDSDDDFLDEDEGLGNYEGVFNLDPNYCDSCNGDLVQAQNGDWICPECDS